MIPYRSNKQIQDIIDSDLTLDEKAVMIQQVVYDIVCLSSAGQKFVPTVEQIKIELERESSGQGH